MRAFITGVAGASLTAEERQFLKEAQPWGLIVFARNVGDGQSLRRLVEEARAALGRQAPVLIDQEGGRVQRLKPPLCPNYPPGAAYGAVYDRDRDAGLRAAKLGARLMAADLAQFGIDVDCAPIADVPVAGSDPIIGDRAYGTEPAKVAAIGGAIAAGLLEGGVLPVLKHIPGHGRATADSHQRLPVVNTDRATLEATDFAAFRPLAALPMGMTAHVVFTALDPVAPATSSASIVGEVIRKSIGFQGLLMSDDVSMGALSGSLGERTKAAIAAGCDMVLHCNGKMSEMTAVAGQAPLLAGTAAAGRTWRSRRASPRRRSTSPQAGPSFPISWRARGLLKGLARPEIQREWLRMNVDEASIQEFEAQLPERATDEPALVVDVEGFEGPLDLLLTLARQQKVDLSKISILALADQYIAFIEAARKMRLELAADYLVMAAWLAYLKSRLLLPEQHAPDGVSAEDLANALAQRLRRLEGIRHVADQLLNRPQLGRDVFARGAARADRRNHQAGMDGDALRSAFGLCQPAPDQGALVRAGAQAHRLVACGSARGAGEADRAIAWIGARSTNISSPIWSSRRWYRLCWPRLLRPRWNWSVRATSKPISRARSRRSICARSRAGTGMAATARGRWCGGVMSAESGNA